MIYKSRWQKKVARNIKWHSWFAFYPVSIGGEKAWLMTVERKWFIVPGMPYHVAEYRLKGGSDG